MSNNKGTKQTISKQTISKQTNKKKNLISYLPSLKKFWFETFNFNRFCISRRQSSTTIPAREQMKNEVLQVTEIFWNYPGTYNAILAIFYWPLPIGAFQGQTGSLPVCNENLSLLIMYNLEQYTHSDLLQLIFLKISEAERKVIMAREKLLSLSSNMHENKKDFKCTCTLYHIMMKKQLRGTQ